jgi:hypothetical protein
MDAQAQTTAQAADGAPAPPEEDPQRRPPGGRHGAAPPKAPPPRKARTAAECEQLEQLPNIGPSIAADLRLRHVASAGPGAKDALALYQQLCTGHAASGRTPACSTPSWPPADFMRGAAPRPWWDYTAERKATYGAV